MTPPGFARVARSHAGAPGAVRWSIRQSLGMLLLPALLAGCVGGGRDRIQPEQFGSTTTHSRDYAAATSATCEAARRALLSQGYVITLADADHVNGKKNFQPEPATHVEVEFHVVCATADRQGHRSIAFVNALQDRYTIKKSNNSASLGVSVLGSVSLPFTSSDDSLVKVASETITTEVFYERFFALLERYLAADTVEDVPTSASSPRAPAGLQTPPAAATTTAASAPSSSAAPASSASVAAAPSASSGAP